MDTFSKQLLDVGKAATDAIETFMADKAEYWVEGYVSDPEISEYENPIDEAWPKFYNDGDLNSLVGVTRDKAGGLLIWAILQMDRYAPEVQTYQLDALPTECVCSIADDLLAI